MLGNAPGFTLRDICIADRIEQGGLAVIHVPQHGHHGRARRHLFVLTRGEFVLEPLVRRPGLLDRDRDAQVEGEQLRLLRIDRLVDRPQPIRLLQQVLRDHHERRPDRRAEVLQGNRRGERDRFPSRRLNGARLGRQPPPFRGSPITQTVAGDAG